MQAQNTTIIPHICWRKMDEHTICVRLDNAVPDRSYRVIFNAEHKAYHDTDGLFRYSEAVPGLRYNITCEVEASPDRWEECCSPVKLNFVPPPVDTVVSVKHIGGLSISCVQEIVSDDAVQGGVFLHGSDNYS